MNPEKEEKGIAQLKFRLDLSIAKLA